MIGARLAAVAAIVVAGAVGASAVAAVRLGADPRPVSFARDVQPIFDGKCTACHPISYPYLDLRAGHAYAQLVHVPAETNPAFQRVLPGRPELSYLLTHPPDPSNAALLSTRERELLRRWIEAGARDD